MTSVDSNTGKSINQSVFLSLSLPLSIIPDRNVFNIELSNRNAGSMHAGTRPIWLIFGTVSGVGYGP